MKSSFSRALVPGLVLLALGFMASARAAGPSIPQADVTWGGRAVRANHIPELMSTTAVSAMAARYGKSVPEFKALIARDHDLWVDDQGRLVDLCAGLKAPEGGRQAAVIQGVPPFPLSQTFKLHSRPLATKKLLLDFDGFVTHNTPWNPTGPDIVSTPFDQDGDDTKFSNGELTTIQGVWQAVAEDYAPFDVDVTTEDPGTEAMCRRSIGDTHYGQRIVISPVDGVTGGTAGGVAFLGSFDWVNSADEVPCFCFSIGSGNDQNGIGSATCPHELGHTLGLNHDGTSSQGYYDGGSGPWAPIMGVGYGKPIVQFSKGEYPDANNLEDDYLVMQSHTALLRTDDYGNTPATAGILPGPNPSVTGVIERRTDKDFFRFATQAGNITVTAAPWPQDPDLDIQLDLVDSNGTVIESANPGGLGASITRNVPAGTYYVSVDGVGTGDPSNPNNYSDYGSLGNYTLTANVIGGISIQVTAPNGNESFGVGETKNITWTSTGIASNVKLEYSIDDGATWFTIAANTANDGIEPWTVPNKPTTQALVRVSTLDGVVTDQSNKTFTITTAVGDSYETDDSWDLASTILPGDVQNHSIHIPGDEDWVTFTLDERSNITLTTDGPAGDTILELYDQDGQTLLDSDDDGGNGAFSQIVRTGAGGLPAGTYFARVREKTGQGTIDAYTLSFTTSPGAALKLTAPNGGEDWLAGSSHVITWDKNQFSGDVKLEWYDGSTWWVITGSTPNDGFEQWTVPNVPTDQALVRVSGTNDPLASDESDDAFTISAKPQPFIEVTAPNGGESFQPNSIQQITWDSQNVSGTVRVEYSTNGGKTWTKIAITNANDGEKDWTVPNVITQLAEVRVVAVDGSASDTSDDFFEIPGPPSDDFEVDDTPGEASTISSGETQQHSIHLPNNPDWVVFTLNKKKKVTLTTDGDPGGDTVLSLYKSNGSTLIVSNDNKPGSSYSQIKGKQLPAGTYFVKVTGRGGSVIDSYTLSFQAK